MGPAAEAQYAFELKKFEIMEAPVMALLQRHRTYMIRNHASAYDFEAVQIGRQNKAV